MDLADIPNVLPKTIAGLWVAVENRIANSQHWLPEIRFRRTVRLNMGLKYEGWVDSDFVF